MLKSWVVRGGGGSSSRDTGLLAAFGHLTGSVKLREAVEANRLRLISPTQVSNSK